MHGIYVSPLSSNGKHERVDGHPPGAKNRRNSNLSGKDMIRYGEKERESREG